MKRLMAFGASMLVTAVLLAGLGSNAYLVDNTPAGQVQITQLNAELLLARAAP